MAVGRGKRVNYSPGSRGRAVREKHSLIRVRLESRLAVDLLRVRGLLSLDIVVQTELHSLHCSDCKCLDDPGNTGKRNKMMVSLKSLLVLLVGYLQITLSLSTSGECPGSDCRQLEGPRMAKK